ncbi:MAG: hypothetical protein K2Q24_14470 [Chitinophagaceae bacterium]|nr:hypothetical protein [Chitinophagaceae bacterium]
MDGFDPQNERSYTKLYNEFLSYTKSGTPTLLGDELRDKGYDVIILNFPKLGSTIDGLQGVPNLPIPAYVKVNGTSTVVLENGRDGGADYIERNAMLLVKLIQQVNATLLANGSTEKLVIVGPSMGGLISRYALSYMEKQQSLGAPNMNHNCRVWVSFDSPHDGANISPAAQHSIRFLAIVTGEQGVKYNYEKKLRSIAARQQLIEQVDGLNSTNSYHNTFYTNLKNNGLTNSGGFPMNVRKVNLLNGTGNGTNTLSPGAHNLSGEGFKRIFGPEIKVLDIENWFMPTYSTSQLLSYTLVLNPFPPVYIWSKRNVTNTNSRGSMDAVQGSHNDNVIPGIRKGVDESSKFSSTHWAIYNKEFCFVPTISALGFKQPVSNWHTRVDNRNLLCNNEINFDGYFMPPTNEKHIFLTEANVNWVIQEIDKGQPGCPTICTFSLSGGVNELCVNSTSTYTLDIAAPAGTSVQWIVSSNLQVMSSSSASITVKALSIGAGSIKAKIVNPCGADSEIFKSINISNTPTTPIIFASNYDAQCGTFAEAYSSTPTGATSLVWNFNFGQIIQDMSGYGSDYFYTAPLVNTPQQGQTYYNYLTVQAKNVCGLSDPSTTVSMTVGPVPNCDGGGGGGPILLRISPNPAGSSANVEALNNTYFIKLRILDRFGNVKKEWNYPPNSRRAFINLNNLPEGVYFLKAFDGTFWRTISFIKQ